MDGTTEIIAGHGADAWAGRITAAWRASIEAIIETGRLLIEAKAELQQQQHGRFTAMVERDLPFSVKTAQRLMRIASDNKITKGAHAHLLPSSWYTLWELLHVDDATFAAALDTGAIHPEMTRKEAVALRTTPRGPQITLKVGATPEEGCRAGMAIEKGGGSIEAAANRLGVDPKVYRQMRDIVMVADRTDLSPRQRAVADEALRNLNERRQAAPAHRLVEPLVARIYGSGVANKAKPDRREARRLELFDHAMSVLAHACSSTADMDVPHLSAERARHAAAAVDEAIAHLKRFRNRIMETD